MTICQLQKQFCVTVPDTEICCNKPVDASTIHMISN